jgi:hypothetical protein
MTAAVMNIFAMKIIWRHFKAIFLLILCGGHPTIININKNAPSEGWVMKTFIMKSGITKLISKRNRKGPTAALKNGQGQTSEN